MLSAASQLTIVYIYVLLKLAGYNISQYNNVELCIQAVSIVFNQNQRLVYLRTLELINFSLFDSNIRRGYWSAFQIGALRSRNPPASKFQAAGR